MAALVPWLRKELPFISPEWRLPLVVWDRPKGRDTVPWPGGSSSSSRGYDWGGSYGGGYGGGGGHDWGGSYDGGWGSSGGGGPGSRDPHRPEVWGGSSGSGDPHRPAGREHPSAWHPDPAKRAHPTGMHPNWGKWRVDNPGAARRSSGGEEAREKNKEAIWKDPCSSSSKSQEGRSVVGA